VPPPALPPSRRIVNAEARAWLAANPAPRGASVITSLPDVSETDLSLEAWRSWFVDAAREVMSWVPEEGVAIFFQATNPGRPRAVMGLDCAGRGGYVPGGGLLVLPATANEDAWADDGGQLRVGLGCCRTPRRLGSLVPPRRSSPLSSSRRLSEV
jgi:hypothetical protein